MDDAMEAGIIGFIGIICATVIVKVIKGPLMVDTWALITLMWGFT